MCTNVLTSMRGVLVKNRKGLCCPSPYLKLNIIAAIACQCERCLPREGDGPGVMEMLYVLVLSGFITEVFRTENRIFAFFNAVVMIL